MFRKHGRRGARWAGFTVAALGAGLLAACGGDAGADDGGLRVQTSFYPLRFVTQRIVGDAAVVGSLTKPGVEPHDVELTPRQIGSVADADLVVYLAGFQSAVDDALVAVDSRAGFDVSGPARLTTHTSGTDDDGDEHADDATDEHADALDPHFWLDPTRLADVSDAVAARLAVLAPDLATTFAANAADLRADLTALRLIE